jgi:hypothetical protein
VHESGDGQQKHQDGRDVGDRGGLGGLGPELAEAVRGQQQTPQGHTLEDGLALLGGPSPEPQDLFPQRILSDRDRAPGRDFEPEPLVAILGTNGDSLGDQLKAGYALQRVLLTLTDLGLAASMLSQPIEVPAAREQLRLALGRYGTPQMVLRIGYGQPGITTPRRDPSEVIDTIPV